MYRCHDMHISMCVQLQLRDACAALARHMHMRGDHAIYRYRDQCPSNSRMHHLRQPWHRGRRMQASISSWSNSTVIYTVSSCVRGIMSEYRRRTSKQATVADRRVSATSDGLKLELYGTAGMQLHTMGWARVAVKHRERHATLHALATVARALPRRSRRMTRSEHRGAGGAATNQTDVQT